MTRFEVGQPFPVHNRARGVEETRIDINEEFFDMCFYSSQAAKDAKMFTKGKMRYGVFVEDNIPFFIIEFVGDMSIEASFNFLKLKQDKVDHWLNSKANSITLYLIDNQTNILHGMRLIGIKHEVADQFRDACEAQDNTYATHNEVEIKTLSIVKKFSAQELLHKTIMHTL